jgi:hypothetical protein
MTMPSDIPLPRRATPGLALSGLALSVLALSGTARADGRKSVVVLEYRAGARGAPNIGLRLAAVLRKHAALDVIDVAEARRRMGARVDAEVARCSGEAMCTGALGEQLGATEVLLVGVSQLGDVVIALQRIDSKRGQAGARLAESMAPDSDPTDDELLSWLRQLFPPEAFRRFGAIQIVTDVAGARISLNGADEGATPLGRPLRVPAPAAYRLRLDKIGYAPFQARIDVLPDATVEVRASLVRDTGPTPWYKRWYVWAIVGGAAAAAGAGIAIYYGTRPDPTVPVYIMLPK